MDNIDSQYTVVVSETAKRQLIEHSRFLANVSRQAAMRLITEFEQLSKSLESFPYRNPIAREITSDKRTYYKLLLSGRYLLLYQIKKYTVYIDLVVDCRQEYNFKI